MKTIDKKEYYNKIIKMIDIAIIAYSEKGDKSITSNFLPFYNSLKDDLKIKSNRLSSLKFYEEQALTYFQEGAGKVVELFWEKINDANIDYKRENKLLKILGRKKIKNESEYHLATDAMLPQLQMGIITQTDFDNLSRMIGDFENKHSEH